VVEWLACWTQENGLHGFKSQPRRCRVDAVGKTNTSVFKILYDRLDNKLVGPNKTRLLYNITTLHE